MPATTKSRSAKRSRTTATPAVSGRTVPARAARPAANGAPARRRAIKWVYLFEDGNAQMRDLLGGKGAGVAEMTRAGLPVPPGFTITTEACNAFYAQGQKFPEGMWGQVLTALKTLERKTGKGFGDTRNPLLVSVRSGAKFSMPGMMDTVLNLGLNETTLQGLARLTGDERFALDSYRRFIQLFSKIVLDVPGELFEHALDAAKRKHGAASDAELSPDALRELIETFRGIVSEQHRGEGFPEEPLEQLRAAIGAVFDSWNGKRAVDYRNYNKIPHDLGTAVNVQSMVFGNMGDDSGTGVAFTRDPATGEKALYGEYLINAQGEDVVAGIRTPKPIAAMADELPKVYRQFEQIAKKLERHYRDVQDMEFTIERGKLYMLQTRTGKRTAEAAVRIAVEMVKERLITREEAVLRIEPVQVDQLLHTRIDPSAKVEVLATGLAASPGAAYGKAVFDADRAEAMAKAGEKVIMVRIETNPDDVHGMIAAEGVLTSRGGRTSHAAVVARGMGKPCVAGAESSSWTCRAAASPPVERPCTRATSSPSTAPRAGHRRQGADDPTRAEWGPGAGAPLGRRDPPAPGVGQRRLSARRRAGPPLRRPGHRPLPHRAHVHGAGAAADRPGDDPGQLDRGAPQAAGPAAALPARRLLRHPQGDGRAAGGHPAHRSAAPRVPALVRGPPGRGRLEPRPRASRRRVTRTSGPCLPRCAHSGSRTRCSACAAAGWGSSSPRSSRCRCGRSWRPRCS